MTLLIDNKLWLDVWKAAQRAGAVAILVAIHWGLQRLLKIGALPEFVKVEWVASAISMLAFLLIYARLSFDMVVIFWPLPKFATQGAHDQGSSTK